jgi:precorrin isomerase
MDYLRDPAAIYDRSFEIIREEANLASLPADLEAVAVRLIHSCGMPEIVPELRFDASVATAARSALWGGALVLVDCRMVEAAIIPRLLPAGNAVRCTLDDERTLQFARERGTTRSSAAVELWDPYLEGAVVAIGNAPTALFALLEALDAGAPKPAALFAFPVGFVGAAESKAALAQDPRGVPFLTLLGRRGGSAMAGAAINALGLETAS